MGSIFPAFHVIDFQVVKDAAWLGLPTFSLHKFSLGPMTPFILISFATICEHLGDTLRISKVVDKDFYKDSGLRRTLLGDALRLSGPPSGAARQTPPKARMSMLLCGTIASSGLRTLATLIGILLNAILPNKQASEEAAAK